MKVAVVGTGIAGNVAARRLAREHEVTVFEASSYIGGHSNTIAVTTDDGEVPLDTGFMVFNDRTYPNFIRLLSELGVASQETMMSFSVQCPSSDLEYNGSNLNSLFAQRRNLLRPRFYRMIADILRFNREAPSLVECGEETMSLGEYLQKGGYSDVFASKYLLPMASAIWSAVPDVLAKMPTHFFVRFFQNHGLLDIKNRPAWHVIRGGSREYVKKLVAGHIDRIHLNRAVHSIERKANGVTIRSAGAEPESFDVVFLACHSDQALQLLDEPTSVERDVLGAIAYQENDVVLHSDASLMPKRRAAWAAWNYHVPAAARGRVTVTYHLNRLQSLNCDRQYFVTLNPEQRIREEAVIRRLSYDHPMFTARSVAAQARHVEINGINRTYYCGAYWRNGFHEDGVVSALRALEHFDQREDYAQQHFQRAS